MDMLFPYRVLIWFEAPLLQAKTTGEASLCSTSTTLHLTFTMLKQVSTKFGFSWLSCPIPDLNPKLFANVRELNTFVLTTLNSITPPCKPFVTLTMFSCNLQLSSIVWKLSNLILHDRHDRLLYSCVGIAPTFFNMMFICGIKWLTYLLGSWNWRTG